jgi:hypothetical protein
MPMIQVSAVLAAGAVVDNVLTGSQFEYLPFNAALQFAVNGSAAGLVSDVYSGQDVLAERFQVNTINRFPVFPDDYTLDDVAGAGERIKVRLENTTGGNLTYFVNVKITPIG